MELCRRTGVDLKLLLDTVEQADALADVREATGVTRPSSSNWIATTIAVD